MEGLDWKIELHPTGDTIEDKVAASKGKKRGYKVQAEGYLSLPENRGVINFRFNLKDSEVQILMEKAKEAMEQVFGKVQEKTLAHEVKEALTHEE